MDWIQLCLSAVEASDEERAALEARVAADPNDVEARVRLVGAHTMHPGVANDRARAVHLIWLATHRPDVGLEGLGFLDRESVPDEHARLIAAWQIAVSNPAASTEVLRNAACFLALWSDADAEHIYRREMSLDPGAYRWRAFLARTLMRQDRPLEAIEELVGALERADNEFTSLLLCLDLLAAVVMSKQWDWVAELAPRILANNEDLGPTWNYGDAVHKANIALGWAAHARGEFEEALFHLFEAAKTPGSEQLARSGPDLRLAEALFDLGARAPVRAYLVECRRFWSGADAAISALDKEMP